MSSRPQSTEPPSLAPARNRTIKVSVAVDSTGKENYWFKISPLVGACLRVSSSFISSTLLASLFKGHQEG